MALLQLSALFRLRSVLHWDVWSLVVAFIHPWDHWTVGTAHAHSASQTGFAPASAQYASGLSFHCSSIHFTTLKGDHGIDGALGGNFGLQGLGGLGGNGDEEPHEVRVHQLFDPHSVWLSDEHDWGIWRVLRSHSPGYVSGLSVHSYLQEIFIGSVPSQSVLHQSELVGSFIPHLGFRPHCLLGLPSVSTTSSLQQSASSSTRLWLPSP